MTPPNEQLEVAALLRRLLQAQPEAQAFREAMAQDMAVVKVEVREINAHLKRVNGTVAENVIAIGELQLRAAERNVSCPHITVITSSVQDLAEELRSGLAANRQAIAERSVEAKTWEKAWKIIQPGAWVLIGFILKLIAEHAGLWK
jgi:hypothetical protein